MLQIQPGSQCSASSDNNKNNDDNESQEWHCHCCTAQNEAGRSKCRVCGRPESYVQRGYPLPYHGANAKIYRPSQLLSVLESVHQVHIHDYD